MFILNLHIIACQIFQRELSYYISQSPNSISITWLPQGLHDTPNLLRNKINQTVAEIEEQKKQGLLKHVPEAIILGYGLCSNGVTEICAETIPIIIPRTDDCIALFLGSQSRYLELFNKYNGTYWLNNGWIETAFIPSKEMIEQRSMYYKEKYSEDNAAYLIEQDILWTKNYHYCGYITSPVYKSLKYPSYAKTIADEQQWEYIQVDGDMNLIEKLTSGQWDDEEFLICPPQHKVVASFDESKIKAVPII